MIENKEQLFKIILILSGVLGSLYILSPFLPVLLLAAVIAFAIEPVVKKIRAQRWFGHTGCIYILVASLFLAITVPFLTILYKVYALILGLNLTGDGKKSILESFGRYKAQILEVMNKIVSQIGLKKTINVDSIISDGFQQVLGRIFEGSTYLITQIPDLLFSFAVFLVVLFLFMRHATWIGRKFYSSELLDQKEGREVVKVLKDTSYAAVFSSLITGLIQSIIVSAGAAFMMEVDVTLVFIVTFFCSFIPVIGAAPIAFFLAVVAFVKGDSGAGIGMIVIGVITGTIDNVIRVMLLKVGKEDLHPVVELLAVIGGVIVLGLPGLFLGPVIISAAAQILPKFLGSEKKERIIGITEDL
jgi:predicted PurR-regulated permease PerM